MELTEYGVDSFERMYCPSTDEVIFGPEMEEINTGADAFVGYWHCEFMDEPTVKDSKLKEAWQRYYNENIKGKSVDWEVYQKFFKEYKNPDWVALECNFHGIACGPISFTVIYVVKSDTEIEEDKEYLKEVDPDLPDDSDTGESQNNIDQEKINDDIERIIEQLNRENNDK